MFITWQSAAPGAFPPLWIISLLHKDLIHLCEKVMRDVLLIIVLGSQQELHSLGGGVYEHKERRLVTLKEMFI